MHTFSATHVARRIYNPSHNIHPLQQDGFNYYFDAERAVAAFLVTGCARAFRTEMTRLAYARGATDARTATRADDNELVLRRFHNLTSELPMGLDVTYITLPKESAPLTIGGVAVSVRPLVAVQRRNERGELEVGVLKLYCSKKEALHPAEAEYIAVLLRKWARRHLKGLGRVNSDLCMLVDTHSGEIHTPPTHPRVRYALNERIESTCGTLAAR